MFQMLMQIEWIIFPQKFARRLVQNLKLDGLTTYAAICYGDSIDSHSPVILVQQDK